MIVMGIIIFTIILCMQWSEGDRKWIQKDSNVMEETIANSALALGAVLGVIYIARKINEKSKKK